MDNLDVIGTIGSFPLKSYQQLIVKYEVHNKLIRCCMNPKPRSCFNNTILSELQDFLEILRNQIDNGQFKIEYLVVTSAKKDIFNLGGDLDLFKKCIFDNDSKELLDYAKKCIDVVYKGYSLPKDKLTTIALIQGDALGGGFEAALSTDYIIAEKQSKFGFPEVLFNLFPGMGAYSFLLRRIGRTNAEKIITSGKCYTAQEMYELGTIDLVVNKGEGENAVYQYIKSENRIKNAIRGVRYAKYIQDDLTYEELLKITTVWAKAVANLSKRDIILIDRIINKQTAKSREVTF